MDDRIWQRGASEAELFGQAGVDVLRDELAPSKRIPEWRSRQIDEHHEFNSRNVTCACGRWFQWKRNERRHDCACGRLHARNLRNREEI